MATEIQNSLFWLSAVAKTVKNAKESFRILGIGFFIGSMAA
jgi:hypothetical protein